MYCSRRRELHLVLLRNQAAAPVSWPVYGGAQSRRCLHARHPYGYATSPYVQHIQTKEVLRYGHRLWNRGRSSIAEPVPASTAHVTRSATTRRDELAVPAPAPLERAHVKHRDAAATPGAAEVPELATRGAESAAPQRFARDGPTPLSDSAGNRCYVIDRIVDHADPENRGSRTRHTSRAIPKEHQFRVFWLGYLASADKLSCARGSSRTSPTRWRTTSARAEHEQLH